MAISRDEALDVLRIESNDVVKWNGMGKIAFFIAVLVACTLAAGCKTRPIEPSDPIPVPRGLTQLQVRDAILYALSADPAPTDPPPELTPGEEMADKGLAIALWPFYRRVGSSRKEAAWFLESLEENVVVGGYERGRHYIRAEIRFDRHNVTVRIADAENLDYTPGSRIHKAAFVWIEQLERDIRRALGRTAAEGL